ncbi:MAG: bifunctional adenosylcobinamide kinase/adenosylcobinamide-phosphate guanylyltransferase [Propionibacteriaceae bacterium]|nr:bifunctional adenosylcobinamide kinase/adenosylcobinamide-phosphate guanylyltransferase [Propionibacteriaceae bacterium]
MKTLVLGGARSGKSTYAEELMAGLGPIDYVATAPDRPGDAEWAERVRIHRERRPGHWRTLESPDLAAVLAATGVPVLVDCVGVWLTTQMDQAGVWDEAPGSRQALDAAVDALVAAWSSTPRQVVAVSNEVGLGVVPATASGRRFRDELGRLNMALAAAADRVWFVAAGLPLRLK